MFRTNSSQDAHPLPDPSSCTTQAHQELLACYMWRRGTSMPWGEHECGCPGCLAVPCPGSCGTRGRCGLVALVRETPNLRSLATSTNRGPAAESIAHITGADTAEGTKLPLSKPVPAILAVLDARLDIKALRYQGFYACLMQARGVPAH